MVRGNSDHRGRLPDPAGPAPWSLSAAAAAGSAACACDLATGPRRHGPGRCYQQVPLRVLPPFRFGRIGLPCSTYSIQQPASWTATATSLNCPPGAGVRAVVAGQSAHAFIPASPALCTQQWRVRVAAGAVLAVLPGPAIPFAGCRYYQRVEVDLEVGASLIWGDLWMAGRYARGQASELFQFAQLRQDFTIPARGTPRFSRPF